MSERERFEALMSGRGLACTKAGDRYLNFAMQLAWELWQERCPDGWQCVPKELIDWVKGAQELMRDMPDSDWPLAASQADALLSAAPKQGEL